ncbi:MAG: hypothetical protein ACK4WI_16875, partial [Microcystis sp.]
LLYLKGILNFSHSVIRSQEIGVCIQESVPMKKFSPPEMKEVSFPTPYTPHPTPHTLFQVSPFLESGTL